MQLNDLRVNLTLDNNGFRLSVADSTRILRQFEQRLGSTADATRRTEGAFSSFGSRAHRMIQTIGLARFALMDLNDIMLAFPKAVLTSAGELERMTKLMEGLSTQADATARKIEAASNVKFVFNMAENAPFEVKALTDTLVKFKTGGIDPTNGSMQALVDSVARFGGSSEQLHRASIAIQQMSGKGVISMEELRQQLGEAVPTAMNSMAVGMKMSMAELTTAVSKGTVASNSALKKMLAIMMVENAGAASAMMTTWTGMLERLKTKWEMWKLTVAGEGMAEGAKGALKELIDLFGSPAAASFGRRVGETMAAATMAVINFTKTLSTMWEEIKTAGELLLIYFGASRIAPLLMAGGKAIQGYYASIVAGSAAARATVAADAAARSAGLLSQATMAEGMIASNNAIIASEAARVQAGRMARAAELADIIRSNTAIMGVYAARQTANAAAIAAASPANSTAVRAVQRGVATAAQDLEAQVLLRHAEAARVDQAAITARTAALQAQNVASATERTMLMTTTGALTAQAAARTAQNAALLATSERLRQVAGSTTTASAAMLAMRNAATSVITGIKNMLFSLNGLIIVIMAAAWAWSHFSEKAAKAAKDAEIALNAKKRLEEGNFNEDTVKSSEENIKNKEAEIANLKAQIRTSQNSRGGPNVADLTAKRSRIAGLEADLVIFRKNLESEQIMVARKVGSQAGRSIVDQYTEQVNKQLENAKVSTARINAKYAELTATQGQLTPQQKEAKKKELFEANTVELSNATRMWNNKAAELGKSLGVLRARLNDKKLTQAQMVDAEQEYARQYAAYEGAIKERSNKADALASLESPIDILDTKDKKDKKKSVMDGVLAAINSERNKVARANTSMNSLLDDALDVKALKEDFMNEIDALNENDKDKKVTKKHTSADEQELIDLKTQSAVIERLKNLYGGLAKQRKEIEDDYKLALEKMSTGNFQLQGKGPAERVVDQLEEELKIALGRTTKIKGEAERIREALDDARKILTMQQGVAGAQMFGDNKAGLASMAIANETNERRRLQLQQKFELDVMREKHASQIAATSKNLTMMSRLTAQHNAEEVSMATKHANEMKTPLERLADSWADITKNMETSTERWANSTMDSFVELVTTGKGNFKQLLASMLTDIARMELQKGFGGMVKNGMSAMGGMVASMSQGASGGAGKGDEKSMAFDALMKGFAKLTSGSETAASAVGKGLADSAANAAAGIGEQIAQGAVQVTAEQAAMSAMVSLTLAAEAAATALYQAAAAAAGESVASLFADGGIMTSSGSMPLKMYRNGGIADRPQMAIFGEGDMNEAYVPLPDGRSIPVTMKGGGGGGGQEINITIMVDNTGAESTQSSGSSDSAGAWNKMADRIKDVVRQEMVTQKRPGGMLYT